MIVLDTIENKKKKYTAINEALSSAGITDTMTAALYLYQRTHRLSTDTFRVIEVSHTDLQLTAIGSNESFVVVFENKLYLHLDDWYTDMCIHHETNHSSFSDLWERVLKIWKLTEEAMRAQ